MSRDTAEYYRAWYTRNKEEINARRREHYRLNKPKYRIRAHKAWHTRIKPSLENNPAEKKRRADLHQQHRDRLRLKVIAAYGNKCACCGEPELRFLCIDHVHGGGNIDRRTFKAPIYYRIQRQGYPPEYQVLCFNCNWAKSHGGCPHGNPAGQPVARDEGLFAA